MFFSDPGLDKGLFLATHLSAESFNIEKVVRDDDDDDDGVCGFPLWESMSIAAVGAIDLDKSERVKFEMKPNWVKVMNFVCIYRVIVDEKVRDWREDLWANVGGSYRLGKGAKCWGLKPWKIKNH